MKSFYLSLLIVGIVMLLATESETGVLNIAGLILFSISAYKLELFTFKL